MVRGWKWTTDHGPRDSARARCTLSRVPSIVSFLLKYATGFSRRVGRSRVALPCPWRRIGPHPFRVLRAFRGSASRCPGPRPPSLRPAKMAWKPYSYILARSCICDATGLQMSLYDTRHEDVTHATLPHGPPAPRRSDHAAGVRRHLPGRGRLPHRFRPRQPVGDAAPHPPDLRPLRQPTTHRDRHHRAQARSADLGGRATTRAPGDAMRAALRDAHDHRRSSS